MNLLSPRVIKKLLSEKKIRPSKAMGQNFLIDKRILEKIMEAADIEAKDIVLEIGPGLGTLTVELAKKIYPVKSLPGKFNGAGKVIAIEKDPRMTEILTDVIEGFNNVEIIQGDILNFKPITYNLKPKTYKVVANLPYYITSPVIRKFLEMENPPKEMILMVQKEVAQRICARPPDMNLLAVSVQFYAEPKIISYVSKNSFWPKPKVDSAIIKIVPRYSAYGSALFRERFFRIVKAGFSQPRKQLANNLAKKLKLNKEKIRDRLLKNNILPNQRAETLTIQDWIRLAKDFKNGFQAF